MTKDLISRQAAISLAGDLQIHGDEYHMYNQAINNYCTEIMGLPSAQQERPSKIQDILNYLDTVLHPIISPEHWNVYSELHDMISTLPSAETECTCCEYRVGDLCCYSDVKTDMEAMEKGEESE